MCGVVGVVLPNRGHEAAAVAATALFALQHRGQESAGVGVSDGSHLMIYKDLGMVGTVLDERRIPSLSGDLAVAHCRYSTTGSTVWENAQPTLRLGPRRALAIGHNGNLVNTRELLEQLEGGRGRLPASTDTELLTALLADEPAADTVDALRRVLPRVRGAFSLVILDERRVIGVRDPHGFRPLVLGRLPVPDGVDGTPGLWGDDTAGWILASETAALDIVGATFVRDVEPGEIVVLEPGREPVSVRYAAATPALCVFELIYFARPDSYMEGRSLYEARRRMGMQLAGEHPTEADLVMPVPDTGAPAAAGFAEASGIPYREGLVRNRYSGRTFIQPSQAMRQRGVNVKLNPLRETVRDRRLIVVDDSIVRGTTTKQIVGLLRRAGAREVHLRVSAPPIYHPCFYGIDTAIETELIAASHSVDEIRAFVGADSLGYLSVAGVLAALDLPYDRFCFACFDGNYPEPVPYDAGSRKFILENAAGSLRR
ncbi:MAG: amidophosphoribosyltransferase [Chloroflexota bacterium]